MKIGFYLDNSGFKDVSFLQPELGNPGVGGTQFMISQISYYYAKNFEEDQVWVFAPYTDKISRQTNNIKAESLGEALNKAAELKLDYFVCRAVVDDKIFSLIETLNLKVIFWGHNYVSFKDAFKISKCKSITQYVCVSREQCKYLQGHPLAKKATYIYNSINTELYNVSCIEDRLDSLCYVGSIIKTKGFEKAAEIWRRLHDQGCPLSFEVIGSGQLYNRNAKLGTYGIADESYEKEFIKFLIDENGKILPQVHFHGVLGGEEKLDIMAKCAVGIVNPTGETETFGISAIEFEAMGIPVVTRDTGGFRNVVETEKTGFLCNETDQFVDKIRLLLTWKRDNNKQYAKMCVEGNKFIKENFDTQKVVADWYELFHSTTKFIKERKLPSAELLEKGENILDMIFYRH